MIPTPRALQGLLHVQALAVTGWREALLTDRPVVTLDDLLVGAARSGPFARALAAQGIGADAVREAVRRRDAEDLASIGVRLPEGPPERLRVALPHTAERSVDLTPEARTFLSTTATTEEELLVHLINHASGGPSRALELAGADVPALRAEMQEAATRGRHRRRAEPVRGLLDGLPQATAATELFLPVPAADLAHAVHEPELARQWLVPEQAGVEVGEDGVLRWREKDRPVEYRRVDVGGGVDALGAASGAAARRDGAAAAGTWQLFWPEHDGDPRGTYTRVELSPASGGTDIRLVRGFRGMGRLGPVFARIGAWSQPLGARGLMAQLAGVAQEAAGGRGPGEAPAARAAASSVLSWNHRNG